MYHAGMNEPDVNLYDAALRRETRGLQDRAGAALAKLKAGAAQRIAAMAEAASAVDCALMDAAVRQR